MTASERERVEREAQTIMDELAEAAMPTPSWLRERVVDCILRERAAAFEAAANGCREALNEERRALNAGGYIEACMELESRCRALAAQERAR